MSEAILGMSPQKAPRVSIYNVWIRPGRCRKDFSGLEDLYESILKHGVCQPICVDNSAADCPSGKVELIAGECRLRCLMRGVLEGKITDATIPYMWKQDTDELTRAEIELDENIRRKNISWDEQSAFMLKIHELGIKMHGEKGRGAGGDPQAWTVAKTAAKAGVETAHASQQLNLARLIRARPDLKARLTSLPMKAAAKEAERIQQGERAQRLHETGQLKIDEKFLFGDARELILAVPNESVDLWLTDMPFGNSTIEAREGEKGSSTQSYLAKLKSTDNLNITDCEQLMVKLIPEVYRVLKPGSHFYLFFGFEMFQFLYVELLRAGFELQSSPLIWNKMRSTSPPRGYEYSPCYEPIFYGRKPPRDKRRLNSDAKMILDHKPLPVNEKLHPFEKPQPLLDFLIKQSTQLGDVVLDTFAASASTLLAARNANRSGLGFEIDKETFYRGQGRLAVKSETKTV